MIPAFFFVSGYFYEETPKIFSYVKKRFKRLVIPYYSWNLFYAVVFFAVTSIGLVQWVYSVNLSSFFVQPWITGNQYLFNLAAWFVLSLFLIQVVFVLIRRTFNKLKLTNEYFLFAFFLALGLIGTYLVSLGYTNSFYLILDRTLFGLPFVQLGVLYKTKLEKFDKPSIISVIALIIAQFSLLQIYGNLDFDTLSLTFHGKILEPFLTSFTGIWLCLQVSMVFAKILSPRTLPSRLLKHIGDNSWSIMVNQFLGFWLLSTAFFVIGANGFNLSAYKTNIYYEYLINGDAHFAILYLLVGISFPLLFTYGLIKLRGKATIFFKKRKNQHKNSSDSN
jgi:fucose 4-O-acetylase-like acetyltransferase